MKPSYEWSAGSTWSRRSGARTIRPQSPITTLGTAASVSTSAVTGPRIPLGASSLRNSAMPSAIGVAITSALIEVITFQMIRMTSTSEPNAASPATPCRMKSPRRTRRPPKGRRAASVLTSREVTNARDSLLLRADLVDLLLVERHDRLGQRLEDERRAVLLTRRDRPGQELLDVRGVRTRALLHVDVRVGADRVGVLVL